jgi:hypothetical protein
MRKSKFIILLIILVSAPVFATDPVKAVIGGKAVTFPVPDDYDALLRNYRSVVDMLVEAENDLIRLKDSASGVVDQTGNVNKSVDALVEAYMAETDLLIKYNMYLKRPHLMFGGNVSYNINFLDTGSSILSVSPLMAFSFTPRFMVTAQIPLSLDLSMPVNYIALGLGFGFLVRPDKQ